MKTLAAVVFAALALLTPANASAATDVSGHRDTNAPLVIDPSGPTSTTEVENTRLNAMVITDMPVTKRIRSVTIGDFARGASCTGSDPALKLAISRYPGGDLGAANELTARTVEAHRLGSQPARLTWTLAQPATLKRGETYVFRVSYSDNPSNCRAIQQTTWGHNTSSVNGGGARCTIGPSIGRYAQHYFSRAWHVYGQNDVNCGIANFEPDMPTGWLLYSSMGCCPRVHAAGVNGDACDDPYYHANPTEYGGERRFWKNDTNVCVWPQFRGLGDREAEHGWYYAMPWPKPGAPRDMYLRLETMDYSALLREYLPAFDFDGASNYWNASPATITQWHENALLDGGQVLLDHPDRGTLGWGLSSLVPEDETYPGTSATASADDSIVAGGDPKEAADWFRYGHLDNMAYGRAVHDASGALWLQYWVFYYFNELGPPWVGEHEGDWEMVQYRFGVGETPDSATYAQHGRGEACSWSKVRTRPVPEGGGTSRIAPLVYVAAGSQASYFIGGVHQRDYLPSDSADGEGELRVPVLTEIGEDYPGWNMWPGAWGFDPKSPEGPNSQTMWSDPTGFHAGAETCKNLDGSPR